MAIDHEQAAENGKFLFKMILGVFVVTYFIWYLGGGPERWNEKMRNLKDEDGNKIFIKGIIEVKN